MSQPSSLATRLLLLLLPALLLAAAQPASAQHYKGKTITVLVGLEVGGTIDTLTRSLVPYWSRHIPGQPTMIVRNMTGGGGIVAANYLFEKADRDGLTVLFGPWHPIAEVTGEKALRARYGAFEYLGGTQSRRVSYARTDAVPGGMKRPADIVRAPEIIVGGNNVAGTSEMLARMGLDVLGLKYKSIPSYKGGNDVFLVLQRGEVNFHNTNLGTFRTRAADMIRRGEVMGLYYFVPIDAQGSYKRDPGIPEMPAFPDIYKEVHGRLPSGPMWDLLNWYVTVNVSLGQLALAPPGTPAAAVEDLRAGFTKALQDKELREHMARTGNLIDDSVPVAEGKAYIARVNELPPRLIDNLRAYMKGEELR